MSKLILLILLVMTFGHVTVEKALMSIILQKCLSYCHPQYCNISSLCRPLNRTSKLVSLDIYLHPGVKLTAPIYIEIVAFKKFTTVYRPHMLKLKSELCKELLLANHPLFALKKNTLMTDNNLLEPCPMMGHRYMKPRISNVKDYLFPQIPLIPAGEWRLDIIISQKINGSEVVIVSWNDFYEVKTLTAEEF